MTLRADLSVGQRLGIGLGVMALVIVLLGAVTTAIVVRVQDLVHRETDVIEPRADAADALKRAIYHTAIAARAYAMTRETREIEALRRAATEGQHMLRQLEGMPHDPASRRLFDAVVPLHAAYQDRVDDLLGLLRDNGTVASPAGMTAAESALQSREQLLEAVRLYQARQLALAVEMRGEVRAAVARLTLTIAAAAVLVLLVTSVTIALVGRSIREPAGRLADAAQAVAAGEYAPALALAPVAARTNGTTPRLRDELGELARGFARMAELLRHREERLSAGRASGPPSAARWIRGPWPGPRSPRSPTTCGARWASSMPSPLVTTACSRWRRGRSMDTSPSSGSATASPARPRPAAAPTSSGTSRTTRRSGSGSASTTRRPAGWPRVPWSRVAPSWACWWSEASARSPKTPSSSWRMRPDVSPSASTTPGRTSSWRGSARSCRRRTSACTPRTRSSRCRARSSRARTKSCRPRAKSSRPRRRSCTHRPRSCRRTPSSSRSTATSWSGATRPWPRRSSARTSSSRFSATSCATRSGRSAPPPAFSAWTRSAIRSPSARSR